MMDTELDTAVRRQMTVLNLLCGALLSTLAIYVVIGWILQQQGELEVGPVPQQLPLILSAVGVSMLFVAHGVAGALMTRARQVEEPAARLAPFQNAVVVGFALRESAAVLGLVVTLLTGDLRYVAALAVLAAGAMLAAWPRRSTLDDLVCEVRPIG